MTWKYKLSDFKVVSRAILKTYDINDTRTTMRDYIQAYEIYRVEGIWIFKYDLLITRVDTLEEAASWLYMEAGNGLSIEQIQEIIDVAED